MHILDSKSWQISLEYFSENTSFFWNYEITGGTHLSHNLSRMLNRSLQTNWTSFQLLFWVGYSIMTVNIHLDLVCKKHLDKKVIREILNKSQNMFSNFVLWSDNFSFKIGESWESCVEPNLVNTVLHLKFSHNWGSIV